MGHYLPHHAWGGTDLSTISLCSHSPARCGWIAPGIPAHWPQGKIALTERHLVSIRSRLFHDLAWQWSGSVGRSSYTERNCRGDLLAGANDGDPYQSRHQYR